MMRYYQIKGTPCTEQEFIAWMRQEGMTEIHTQPVEVSFGMSQSKTYRLQHDTLQEVEPYAQGQA